MIYRPLTDEDLPQARNLWEMSFQDPAAFIDWYFEKRFPPEQARGIFHHQHLLCMAQAVPYHFFLRGKQVRTIYIVGLATHRAAREQGFATQLLQNILEEFYRCNLGIMILMPAVPLFYRRRGWDYVYSLQKLDLIPPEPVLPDGQLECSPSIDFSLMNIAYRKTFQESHGWLDRTEKDWQDLLHDYAMDGGSVLYYRDQNGHFDGYILCRITSDQIKIRELAVYNETKIDAVLSSLSRQYSNKPVEWHAWTGQSSSYKPLLKTIEPSVMARIVNPKSLLETIHYPADVVLDFPFSFYDPLLKRNCRTYRWHIQNGAGTLLSVPDHPSYPQLTVGQLTTWVMGEPKEIPPEVEKALPKTLNYMNDLF